METLKLDGEPFHYFKRLQLWLNERFPPINFFSGFLLFLFAKAIVTIPIMNSSEAGRFSFDFQGLIQNEGNWWQNVFGMLIPCLHLFLLRVFDEHKDFESDRIHYPHRVIQRGLFKLEEVKQLGVLAFILQIIAFIALKPNNSALLGFFILWFWTALMVKEFFVKEWLKRNLFLYGLLHLMISPLILFFLILLNSKMNLQQLFYITSKPIMFGLASVLMTGWLYELARKCKGREEETGDASYTKLWGVRKSMVLLFGSAFFSSAISYYFFESLDIKHPVILLGLGSIFILFGWSSFQFIKKPNAAARKKNELMVALLSAYTFLFPIIKSWFFNAVG